MKIEALELFAAELRRRSLAPESIELCTIGTVHIANAYSDLDDRLISDRITTGVDRSPETAALKALVEHLERMALAETAQSKTSYLPWEKTSDGAAAFPIFGDPSEAFRRARENALSEAIERFAWATWWDDPNIAASIDEIDEVYFQEHDLLDFVSVIREKTPFRRILLIRPQLMQSSHEVLIYFVEQESGGFLSGGACGLHGQESSIAFRAFSELIRHSLATARMKESGVTPKSFYEARMHFFASGEGTPLVLSRLAENGTRPIELPHLEVDSVLHHSAEEIAVVHRCVFQQQPAFVGGDLERLCL